MDATTWEYRTLTVDGDSKALLQSSDELVADRLNELGGQGWELVDSSPLTVASTWYFGGRTAGLVFVMKRRLSG